MAEGEQTWDESRVERLRTLWGDGLSASRIAAELGGMTRNMVMGKLHRLGLSRSTRPPVAHAPAELRAAQPRRPRVPTPLTVAPPQPLPRPIAPEAPHAVARPVRCDAPVTIMELAQSMCRWPLGDPASPAFRYCGGVASPGQPYCDGHRGLAYEPDKRRMGRG